MEQAIGEGKAPRSLSAEEWNLVDVSTISRRPGDLATARTFTARAEAMMKNQGDGVGVDGVAGGKGISPSPPPSLSSRSSRHIF